MPWEPRFRKPQVLGVTARAIEVVIETGDSGPLTPIGINLPNDQAIREQYGSKSVSLSNVNEAYESPTPEGMRAEFSWNADEAARARQWGAFAQELTTEMHEVIGHGSGRMAEGVTAPPHQLLKEQFSGDRGVARRPGGARTSCPTRSSSSSAWCRRGSRGDRPRRVRALHAQRAAAAAPRPRRHAHRRRPHAQPPDDRELADGAHLGDRGPAARRQDLLRDDRPAAFRDGVGRLLAEVQRIKGEGDYDAAKALFETYGVHFDPALRDEVVARVDALQAAVVHARSSCRASRRGTATTARSSTSRSPTRATSRRRCSSTRHSRATATRITKTIWPPRRRTRS